MEDKSESGIVWAVLFFFGIVALICVWRMALSIAKLLIPDEEEQHYKDLLYAHAREINRLKKDVKSLEEEAY